VARPREAVGWRTLICRKVASGQLNDLAFQTRSRDHCRLLPVGAGQRKNRSAKQKRVGEVVDPLDLHAGTRVCQRPDR
jgi:hypothetical protein